jgi:hypothetical protein
MNEKMSRRKEFRIKKGTMKGARHRGQHRHVEPHAFS